jgi:hypothetical protein
MIADNLKDRVNVKFVHFAIEYEELDTVRDYFFETDVVDYVFYSTKEGRLLHVKALIPDFSDIFLITLGCKLEEFRQKKD